MSASSFKFFFTRNNSRLGLAVAVAAALATAACSRPAPSTQQPAADSAEPAAATAATTAPATDHSSMDMGDPDQAMDPNAPMAQATAEVSGEFGSDKPVTVSLHLVDMMSGKAMGPEAFELAHTKKMHVLGVDPSLTDYSHSHPDPTGKPGDWTFTFTPKFNRPYHLWLEVIPVGGAHAFVMLTINDKGTMAPVEKSESLAARVGDISASLAFDAPLVAGQAAGNNGAKR